MKVVIFGTGANCEKLLNNSIYAKNIEVIAFSNNDSKCWNQTYAETDVIITPPANIAQLHFDCIIVTPTFYYEEIKTQLITLGIDANKIISINEHISSILLKKLHIRYKDTRDNEIKRMLNAFEKDGVSVFGDFINQEEELDEVFRDSNNHPYIMYCGKKMYFPQNHNFCIRNGKQYVRNITLEQRQNSPHIYLRNDDDIKNGAVIVDAGVCEGNFALKYIEKASKVYLIECDPAWTDALKLTFEPWKEKVVFCNKFLGRYNSEKTITLDTLVQEKIDFLKMDIEGAEIDALLGGSELLTQSHATCAICSYHKQNDEKYIRMLLENFGYDTSASQGYMFFLHDSDIAHTLDFRRGIVYGDK